MHVLLLLVELGGPFSLRLLKTLLGFIVIEHCDSPFCYVCAGLRCFGDLVQVEVGALSYLVGTLDYSFLDVVLIVLGHHLQQLSRILEELGAGHLEVASRVGSTEGGSRLGCVVLKSSGSGFEGRVALQGDRPLLEHDTEQLHRREHWSRWFSLVFDLVQADFVEALEGLVDLVEERCDLS